MGSLTEVPAGGAGVSPPPCSEWVWPSPGPLCRWAILAASLGSQGPGLSGDNLDLTNFKQPRCGVSGSWVGGVCTSSVWRHWFPSQGGRSTSAVLPSEGQPLTLQKQAEPGVRGRRWPSTESLLGPGCQGRTEALTGQEACPVRHGDDRGREAVSPAHSRVPAQAGCAPSPVSASPAPSLTRLPADFSAGIPGKIKPSRVETASVQMSFLRLV